MRVSLREVRDDDLPIFFGHWNEPEAILMAAFTVEDPSDRAAFDARWVRIRSDPSTVNRTIVGSDGEVVGHAAVFGPPGEREVTYWIGREYWGRGVATAALVELLRVVPERPLHARAAADNAASIRVLEKCGFSISGHERGFANARGEEIDEVVLVLNAPFTMSNLFSASLDERLDQAGFRHLATSISTRRIRATLYEAEAGVPIWPYHYHHGIEEWLYVIAGAPVLREPAGRRILTPGDLVCFPSGPVGAHTLQGPGRFAIFSAGHDGGGWTTVYPDSDKISAAGGIFPRAGAVDYWHGEGTAGLSEAVEVAREPETSPPQPAVNAFAVADATSIGPLLGAERLDATLTQTDPYHYTYGRDEWLLVLDGTPIVRHPGGDTRLAAGDVVCFDEGPAGAHALIDCEDSAFRALKLSTTGFPANVHYPLTGRWALHNAPASPARNILPADESGQGAPSLKP